MISFDIADQLAKDLAGARVDPNEAQKALAYLRSKREPNALFDYLNAVVRHGHVVIRSQQTLDYYRNLQQACQRHLRGMTYDEMAQTLGWALRLLRYYRNVPEAIQRATAQADTTTAPSAPTPASATPAQPVQRTITSPKQVGDVFTGKVLEADDEFFRIEVPGHPAVFALLKREPGGPNYRPAKDAARVEVVEVEEVKGKIVLRVRRATKQ